MLELSLEFLLKEPLIGWTKIAGQAAPAGEPPTVVVHGVAPAVPPAILVVSVAEIALDGMLLAPMLNAEVAELSQASNSRLLSPVPPVRFQELVIVTGLESEPLAGNVNAEGVALTLNDSPTM